MEQLFGKTINGLAAVIGYRSERHKVILSNLVNIDTPDYRPKDLVFKTELDNAAGGKMDIILTTTNVRHIGRPSLPLNGTMEVVDREDEEVSLDREMMDLAENHLMYNTMVELLARKFRSLKSAIQEVR